MNTNKELEECLSKITNIFQRNNTKIETLTEENKALKKEVYKDKELTKMKNSLSEMRDAYYRGFPLTKDEEDKIKEWQDQHLANRHHARTLNEKLKIGGVSGGIWSYHFTPTSIGTFASCRCNICFTKAYEAYLNAGKEAKLSQFLERYDAAYSWDDM